VKQPPLHNASELYGNWPTADDSSLTYPGVASIEVRWQKQVLGSGWQRYREPWVAIEPAALGEFIACPDADCADGGCCIGAVIRDTVALKATRRRGRVRCKGQKGPDGKRRWRLCITVFNYDVRVVYREDTASENSGILGDVAAAASRIAS
jgi:hypothetical protein